MSKNDRSTAAQEIRRLIVEAAAKRFGLYGYKKTTMAEIAQDCDMSAANLYRYYRNKQDIGAALAKDCLGDKQEKLREVVRRPQLSAAQRLEEFILTALRFTYDLSIEQPKVNELVEVIASERKEIFEDKQQQERALMAEILAEGNRSGEFEVEDVITTAETVLAASAKFCTPLFMFMYPLDELEVLAEGVARLLVRGLAKR